MIKNFNMATPHINAEPGDFAETVIMPGDPLRAKFIADNFLDNPRLVNDVRGMLGFTGSYKGQALSVMGHGVGIPSCSIYCTELVNEFGVKRIIRAGSCGNVNETVKLRDIIIAMGACTDSKVNRIRFRGHDFAAIADYRLLQSAVTVAEQRGLAVRVGNVFSSDLFYSPEQEAFEMMAKYNILGVEMEAAGIYGLAAELGFRALTICVVSDQIMSGERLTAEERQSGFRDMIGLALETAVADSSNK